MRKKKSLREFIKENRKDLDVCILRVIGNTSFKINDEERRLWILNDEGLYNWARSEGVKI